MNLFLPRLRELLAESGKMQKDICDELGISKQKLSNWKTGYSEPNFDDTPRPQGTTGTKENLFSYASPPFYGRIANRLRGFTLVA